MAKQKKIRFQKLDEPILHEERTQDLFKAAGIPHDGIFKMVLQPDTHVPEHDPYVLEAFAKFLDYYKPHGIINIGDFMELESVSHWESKDASVKRIVPELYEASSILDLIADAAGKQCRYKRFLLGNHEDWLHQYLVRNIPELYDGLADYGFDISIEGLLHLEERGYGVVQVNDVLKVGHANFIHGYYASKAHGNEHLGVFESSVFYGHLESVGVVTKRTVGGVSHMAASIGTFRKLSAKFIKKKPNNWLHAFGVIEFRYDGQFTPIIPVIYDHKFSYNGILFDGKAGI